MSSKTPTLEELMEQVRQSGGSWGDMGGKEVKPPLHDKQVELARRLKGALEQQESILQGELQKAKEALHRVQHGGGS